MALMDVNDEAVREVFRKAGVDLIVHGHTHRPAVHELVVDGRACTRIVLGDWYEQGSCLALGPDGPKLLTLPRSPVRLKVEAAAPNGNETQGPG